MKPIWQKKQNKHKYNCTTGRKDRLEEKQTEREVTQHKWKKLCSQINDDDETLLTSYIPTGQQIFDIVIDISMYCLCIGLDSRFGISRPRATVRLLQIVNINHVKIYIVLYYVNRCIVSVVSVLLQWLLSSFSASLCVKSITHVAP